MLCKVRYCSFVKFKKVKFKQRVLEGLKRANVISLSSLQQKLFPLCPYGTLRTRTSRLSLIICKRRNVEHGSFKIILYHYKLKLKWVWVERAFAKLFQKAEEVWSEYICICVMPQFVIFVINITKNLMKMKDNIIILFLLSCTYVLGASRFLCMTLRHPRDVKGLKKCRKKWKKKKKKVKMKMALLQILNASGKANQDKKDPLIIDK